MQNYMFERFLARLWMSDYREKFVVKGGMLIAAIVGLDTRSTMDLDTTLRNLPLNEDLNFLFATTFMATKRITNTKRRCEQMNKKITLTIIMSGIVLSIICIFLGFKLSELKYQFQIKPLQTELKETT